MSSLRSSAMLRSSTLRPWLSTAPRARVQIRFATQDYGSGKGNPAGEKPQQQGKNPRGDLEHPGPPPPKAAQSKGQQSSSSSQTQSKKSSDSDWKGIKDPQPKILNENPPSEQDASESVKQHNKEMENRAERAHAQIKNEDAKNDKVPPGFWSDSSSRTP